MVVARIFCSKTEIFCPLNWLCQTSENLVARVPGVCVHPSRDPRLPHLAANALDETFRLAPGRTSVLPITVVLLGSCGLWSQSLPPVWPCPLTGCCGMGPCCRRAWACRPHGHPWLPPVGQPALAGSWWSAPVCLSERTAFLWTREQVACLKTSLPLKEGSRFSAFWCFTRKAWAKIKLHHSCISNIYFSILLNLFEDYWFLSSCMVHLTMRSWDLYQTSYHCSWCLPQCITFSTTQLKEKCWKFANSVSNLSLLYWISQASGKKQEIEKENLWVLDFMTDNYNFLLALLCVLANMWANLSQHEMETYKPVFSFFLISSSHWLESSPGGHLIEVFTLLSDALNSSWNGCSARWVEAKGKSKGISIHFRGTHITAVSLKTFMFGKFPPHLL